MVGQRLFSGGRVMRKLLVGVLLAVSLSACGGSDTDSQCDDLATRHADVQEQMAAVPLDDAEAYNALVDEANAIRDEAEQAGCDVTNGF
jgi:hypothetical protein